MNFVLSAALSVMVWLGAPVIAQSAGPNIVGGFGMAETSSPVVIDAVKFAVSEKNAQPEARRVKLISIKSAQQQVVAGMNYKVCIMVRQKTKAYTVSTTVYRDLSGAMILTEWVRARC
jgi:Cystatin domain